MRTSLLVALAALAVLSVVSQPALGQSSGDDPVVVIDISDPLDQRAMDYIEETLRTEPAHVFVLQIDSPGVSSGDLGRLERAILDAPVPVVSWIGPAPAVAYGGAAFVANHADILTAAPGARLGYLSPAVQKGNAESPSIRTGHDPDRVEASVEALASSTVRFDEEGPVIYGFVSYTEPTLGQVITSLDGAVVRRYANEWELSTAESVVIDGEETFVPSRPVKFVKPGLLDRYLRLGARPATAFLFLVFGFAFAIFEYYAAGGGLMALVASLSLIVGGYGLATLPIRWWAVALLLGSLTLIVWGFNRNRVGWRSQIGSIGLIASGMALTSANPQYGPELWLVVLAAVAAVLFIWYTLTTVVRGRFATPTVGREGLLGRACVAVTDLDPMGIVVVDGARWQATADRGVSIIAGAPVSIVGVTGLLLEVDPVVVPPRETS